MLGHLPFLTVDEATAQSAVRNLQDVPINGRSVRVELSADDQRRTGPPPARGGRGSPAFDDFPPGQDLAPGQKATDAISQTLASINPGQMQEVMSNMKTLITTNPEEARKLLTANPQMAYALFQAMLLMNIVDASVLQRIQPLPSANPGGPSAPAGYPPPAFPAYPPPPPAAAGYPPYPPAPAPPFRPPPPPASYNTPPPQTSTPQPFYPPAPPPLPPATQAALAGLPEDQRTMLVQVLQLSTEQVNALDPAQQASVKQLRQQFLGTA